MDPGYQCYRYNYQQWGLPYGVRLFINSCRALQINLGRKSLGGNFYTGQFGLLPFTFSSILARGWRHHCQDVLCHLPFLSCSYCPSAAARFKSSGLHMCMYVYTVYPFWQAVWVLNNYFWVAHQSARQPSGIVLPEFAEYECWNYNCGPFGSFSDHFFAISNLLARHFQSF